MTTGAIIDGVRKKIKRDVLGGLKFIGWKEKPTFTVTHMDEALYKDAQEWKDTLPFPRCFLDHRVGLLKRVKPQNPMIATVVIYGPLNSIIEIGVFFTKVWLERVLKGCKKYANEVIELDSVHEAGHIVIGCIRGAKPLDRIEEEFVGEAMRFLYANEKGGKFMEAYKIGRDIEKAGASDKLLKRLEERERIEKELIEKGFSEERRKKKLELIDIFDTFLGQTEAAYYILAQRKAEDIFKKDGKKGVLAELHRVLKK